VRATPRSTSKTVDFPTGAEGPQQLTRLRNAELAFGHIPEYPPLIGQLHQRVALAAPAYNQQPSFDEIAQHHDAVGILNSLTV